MSYSYLYNTVVFSEWVSDQNNYYKVKNALWLKLKIKILQFSCG